MPDIRPFSFHYKIKNYDVYTFQCLNIYNINRLVYQIKNNINKVKKFSNKNTTTHYKSDILDNDYLVKFWLIAFKT